MSNFTVNDLRQAYEGGRTVIPHDFEEIIKQIDTDGDGDISKLEAKAFIRTIDNYRKGWRPDLLTLKRILEKKILEQAPSPTRSLTLDFRDHQFEKGTLSPWSESAFALPSEGGRFDFSVRYNMASLYHRGPVFMARASTGPGIYFSAYAPEEMVTPDGAYTTAHSPSNGIDDIGILQGGEVTVGVAPFGKLGIPLYVTTGVGGSAQLGRVVYNSFKGEGEEGLPDPVFKIQATGSVDLGLCLPIKLGPAQTLLIEGGQELAGVSFSNIDGATGSLFERNATYARVTLQAN